MRSYVNWLLVLGLLGMVYAIICIFTEPSSGSSRGNNTLTVLLMMVGVILVICGVLVSRSANEIAQRKEVELRKELDKVLREKECEIKLRENKISQKEDAINVRLQNISTLIRDNEPFKHSSSLVADMISYAYDQASSFLVHKQRPAYKAADVIKEMKLKTKERLTESKSIQYRLETLLSIFPELEKYLDEDEGVIALSQYENYDDFKDNRDRVSDYLTDEEYRKLTIDDRNQLALDRYAKHPKTPWQIGVEYEQYIEYLVKKKGLLTIPFGSRMGVNDLGRDIIAKQPAFFGRPKTYIIQCKNWSRKKKKEIHENVICQTFGTAIEYAMSINNTEDVVPVVVSTVPLSSTAQKFADKLGVKVYIVPAGNPPLIKCNINNGEKIYHLPFDQQYYRTEIKNEGEFLAFTVKEATSKGFRRAMKHFVTN